MRAKPTWLAIKQGLQGWAGISWFGIRNVFLEGPSSNGQPFMVDCILEID